jgi:peptide/nickel transport system permease protein
VTIQPKETPLIVKGVESGDVINTKAVSRGRLVLRRLMRRRLAMVGLIVVLLLFIAAFVGPHFTKWTYLSLDPTAELQGPSSSHWFGTTQIGLDVYALTMRGLQKSLLIGLLGALISTGVAAILGALAGYFGGWVDRVVVILIDLLLILPSFLILAILSPLFQGKTWLIFVVLLAAFQWMLTARVVRGLTQSLKEREFVAAARFMGVPGWKIILRHLLPNMASFLIIDATLNVSGLVLGEVALTFFGFGIQTPDVSLGTMIANGVNDSQVFTWLFYFPVAVLIALTLAVNLVGDGLRDALDPNSEFGGAS